MSNWREVLLQLGAGAEDRFDRLKYRLARRLGLGDPLMIQAYRGTGTPEKLWVKGRVLEDLGITPATDNDSVWENLVNMYRRAESDEVPHARVLARFQGAEQEVVADKEGYFELWIKPREPLPEGQLWHEVELEGDRAELLQHEIDHLDGVLAVDRPQGLDPFCLREEWHRLYGPTRRYGPPEPRNEVYVSPISESL